MKKCSKCGGPRDRAPERYCRSCHNAYEREHRKPQTEEQRERGVCRSYANVYKSRGRLVPEPCEACGSTANVEMHHDDYTRPLDVRWLCRPHHVLLSRSRLEGSHMKQVPPRTKRAEP